MNILKIAATGLAVPVLLVAAGGVAVADNVVNDVNVALGDNTITTGGSTTIGYKITANGGDGQSGCNASDGSPVTVVIGVPANVTANHASLTFSACNAFQSVTFGSSVPGDYNINVTSITDSGVGAYSNQANWTLHVSAPPPPPNTAPQVTVTGVANQTYEKSLVPIPGCSVTDAEDTAASATPQITNGAYNDLGQHTVTCAYTDTGGLSDSDSVTYTVVRDHDTTPPVIEYSVTGTKGNNDWYTSDVGLTWTVTENESPETLQVTGCDNQTINTDQQATSYSCSASSEGGDAAQQTVVIKRDATAPTNVSFTGGGISDGASYYFGSVPSAPTGCTADDATSGLASCDLSGGGTAVGDHSYTATATDNAGNQSTVTMHYSVLPWSLHGFYAPVDMGGVLNTVKGGSTVPLKFEVFAGSNELTSTSSISSFKTQKVGCATGDGAEDAIEMVTTGGTSLRYDSTSGQFIQNWKTPTGAGTCYSATMTTMDGSSITALFKIK